MCSPPTWAVRAIPFEILRGADWKKCNLMLAASPTCHSNSPLPIQLRYITCHMPVLYIPNKAWNGRGLLLLERVITSLWKWSALKSWTPLTHFSRTPPTHFYFLSPVRPPLRISNGIALIQNDCFLLQLDNQLPGAVFTTVLAPVPPPKSVAAESGMLHCWKSILNQISNSPPLFYFKKEKFNVCCLVTSWITTLVYTVFPCNVLRFSRILQWHSTTYIHFLYNHCFNPLFITHIDGRIQIYNLFFLRWWELSL